MSALSATADCGPVDAQNQTAAPRSSDDPQGSPACSLVADPEAIAWAGQSALTWTSRDGVSATLDGLPVPLNGRLDVSPIVPTTYTLQVTGAAGTNPAVCSATVSLPELACRNDQACPVFCGTGWIDDIVTGDPILLSPEDMVHVVILPEGYTSVELDAGIFDQDVDDWIAEWQIIDPYSTFRQAFCIWKMPVVSNRHVARTAPQTADTAFLVPIRSDGDGVRNVPLDGPTADRVWAATAGFPFPPTSFYPPGGRTSRIAKNMVIVVLVYDVDVGRSGLSGLSRRLESPNDSDQRLSVAFAHDRPHEFTHAFARLKDEYIDHSDAPVCTPNDLAVDSPNLSNVVCEPNCASIPWAHMLHGTAINPDQDELVGSFGVSLEGFHPELKCLMNGHHDNATYFGGDGRLRVVDRVCNYCREVVVFRLLEHVHVLDDPNSSYDIWRASYRDAFFSRFGLAIPAPIPQENSDRTPIIQTCTGGRAGGAEPSLSSLAPAPRQSRPACDVDDEYPYRDSRS